jgi:hypothetical protein
MFRMSTQCGQLARRHRVAGVVIALLALVLLPGCDEEPYLPASLRAPTPRALSNPPTAQAMQAAIDRGVAFMINSQLADGSWGTTTRKRMGILTGVDARRDFEMATTCMGLQALIEVGADATPEGLAAIERAEGFLLTNLPTYRYGNSNEMFNNWAHAYALQAIVAVLNHRPLTDEQRAEWIRLGQMQIRLLAAYQSLRGGWGYYQAWPRTRPPSLWATSFMTAAALIALDDARNAGLDVPRGMIAEATLALNHARAMDGSFTYTIHYLGDPVAEPNRGLGAMARSPACLLALYVWGDDRHQPELFMNWLDRVIAREGWLNMERKEQFVHTGAHQIAAYYYFYCCYYVARVIEYLPPDRQEFYRLQLAHILLNRQDGDGSWWDFPLYDFYQGYGTSYALMAMQRCLPPEARDE